LLRRRWILPAVVLFLLVSFELARYLSASGTERSAIVALLDDEARGDVPAMLAKLDGCAADPACAALVRRNAMYLKRPGRPKILLLESDAAYKLTTTTGISRVAWTVLDPKSTTVVQCVTVRKSWSLVGGATVHLRRVGRPIGAEASC
jgi:hypothetical protein